MKTLASRVRIPLLLALLALPMLACDLGDILSSPATPAQPVQNPPAVVPSCRPATTASQVGDLLFEAETNEHDQPQISIILLFPNSSQVVELIRPDQFRWRTEAGGYWEEVISVGGTVYVSSSSQAWQTAPFMDPAVAAIMQGLINPPVKLSEATLRSQLEQSGVTDVKFEGHLVGLVADFSASCLYDITVKSGDRIIYSQQTWIDPGPWLRLKFEAKDETRQVIETRLFDYEGVTIVAP